MTPAPMMSWAENYAVIERVTGRKMRLRAPIPGPLLRGIGSLGDLVKHVIDFAYPLTYDALEYATRWPVVDASRATRELGLRFRPVEETYADAIRWMHRDGRLSAKLVGKLAG